MQYRVFGRKYQDYYTKVDANNAYEAMELANKQDTTKWFQLEDDDTIEAIDVILEENFDQEFDTPNQDIQLNSSKEDEWPDMSNGILVEF